jgi:hypothetical protein
MLPQNDEFSGVRLSGNADSAAKDIPWAVIREGGWLAAIWTAHTAMRYQRNRPHTPLYVVARRALLDLGLIKQQHSPDGLLLPHPAVAV